MWKDILIFDCALMMTRVNGVRLGIEGFSELVRYLFDWHFDRDKLHSVGLIMNVTREYCSFLSPMVKNHGGYYIFSLLPTTPAPSYPLNSAP